MTMSSRGTACTALVASSLVLQACGTAPPADGIRPASGQTLPTPDITQEAVDSLAREMGAIAMLHRARALEAEAAQLRAEASRLEGAAHSLFGSLLGSWSAFQFSSAEENRAASLRARATSLSREASELRKQADIVTHGKLAAAAIGGMAGTYTPPEPNPSGTVGAGQQEPAAVGIPPSPPSPKPPPPVTPHRGVAGVPVTPASPVEATPPARPSPAAILAAGSEQIDGLIRGSAAVSAPSTATAGDTFSVFLRVSPEKLVAVMQSLQDEFPENLTVKGKEGIKLTPRMTASVSGFGFEVSPESGQVQAISAKEATTWAWQVKAVEPGLHTLTFTLSGTLSVEGQDVPRNFYDYRQKVQVAVSPIGFVERNWQWLTTTLVLPIITFLWTYYRKPRDASGKPLPSRAEKRQERRREKKRKKDAA